ncbi:hypothetical protein CR513_30460, partial [Mucuna pruriens]
MEPRTHTHIYRLFRRKYTSVVATTGSVASFSQHLEGSSYAMDGHSTGQTFSDLADSFVSQFVANRVKRLEVDDLFNIKQKGLRASPFSDALALRRPSSMEEIRARAKKHIEVEEDQTERLEAERDDHKDVGRPSH